MLQLLSGARCVIPKLNFSLTSDEHGGGAEVNGSVVLLVPTYMHRDGFWYVKSRMRLCTITTIKLLESEYQFIIYVLFPCKYFPWYERYGASPATLESWNYRLLLYPWIQTPILYSYILTSRRGTNGGIFSVQQEIVHLQPLLWTRQPHS